MRILAAAAGSRGDIQPLIALSVALKRSGHDVILAAGASFESEAAEFGLQFGAVGMDLSKEIREAPEQYGRFGPARAFRAFNEMIRGEMQRQFEALPRLARGADLVVAAGAQFAARSVAEALGVPYRNVVYAPEILPSRHHAPILVPWRLPRVVNRATWTTLGWFYELLLRPGLEDGRRKLGLLPVRRATAHLFDPACALFAADPELAPLPDDVRTPEEPVGALQLPDERPLPGEVERFLAAGPPPVYVGFGSMPDGSPERTTRALAQGIQSAGCRAILSSGWAGLGAADMGPDILVVGAVNHRKLLPRVALAVHHGGAGTTAAAARAGIPQLLVPHAFDQYAWARRVHARGLGPAPFPKSRLTKERIAAALGAALAGGGMRERARSLGKILAERDALGAAVQRLESLAKKPRS